MNKIKLLCLSTLLIGGVAAASTPCNGFEIKIKNHLLDDLLVSNIKLNGADIQPGGFQKLNSNEEQVFTVNNSMDDLPMTGDFVFHTISLPVREVKIHYSLKNSGLICEHEDRTTDNDYSVEKTRTPGKVTYSISNK